MPTTHLQVIINEVSARLKTVAGAEHLEFHAGDLPQTRCTAFGKPSQEAMDSESGGERFALELPIGLNAPADAGASNHTENLISLYGEVKLALFGGNAADIDISLGGLAELVLEDGLTTDSSFDYGVMEADGFFTVSIQYQTALGDPYTQL